MIDTHKIMVSILKMMTWFLGVTFTSKLFFDYSLFKYIYKKFCIICTVYLFIQMISWNTLHVYLPNLFNIGFFKPLYEQYSAESYVTYLSAIGFGRFSSFLAEPSYYGILMVISLVILLFDEFENKELPIKYQMYVLTLILGIWISTSTASILFVAFIILVYFIKIKASKKLIVLLIVLPVIIGTVLMAKNNHYSNPITSFFFDKVTTMGTSGRVGGSYQELNQLNPLQKLFGVGLSNEGVVTHSSYFNAITGLLMEYGFIGFLLFVLYLLKMYFSKKSIALHVLMIIYFAAMAQGGYLFNLYGILLFSIMQKFDDKSEKESVFT